MINKLSIFAFAALLAAGAWATHGTWETELDFTALVQLATEATGPMDPDFSLHGMIQAWERAPGSSMGFAMPPDSLRAESFSSPGPLPFFVSASPGDTTAAPPQATTPRPQSRKALLSAVRATPRAEILPSAGTLGYGAIHAADANGGAWYYVNDVTPETYPSYYPQPPAGPFSDQLFILDAANNYSMTFAAKVLGYDFAAGVTPIVDLAFAVDGHYDESPWTIYRNPISPAGEQSDGKFLWEINGLTKDLSEWLDGKEHTLDVFFILSDQNSSDDESFNRYWYGSDGDVDSEGRYGPIASARFTSNATPVIPEPATTSLLALGAFVALLRRRARRQ